MAGAPGERVLLQTTGPVGLDANTGMRSWDVRDFLVDGSHLNAAGGASAEVRVSHGGSDGSPQAPQPSRFCNVHVTKMRNPTGRNAMGWTLHADHVTLEHCACDGTHLATVGDARGSHGVYAAAGGASGTIRGGAYHHTGGFGIPLNDAGRTARPGGNRGWVIEGVHIHHNGLRSAGKGGGGSTLSHTSRDHGLRGNRIALNEGPGLRVEGGANQGHIITGNRLTGNTGACVTTGSDPAHVARDLTCCDTICDRNGGGARFGVHTHGAIVTGTTFHDASAMRMEGAGATVSGNRTSAPTGADLPTLAEPEPAPVVPDPPPRPPATPAAETDPCLSLRNDLCACEPAGTGGGGMGAACLARLDAALRCHQGGRYHAQQHPPLPSALRRLAPHRKLCASPDPATRYPYGDRRGDRGRRGRIARRGTGDGNGLLTAGATILGGLVGAGVGQVLDLSSTPNLETATTKALASPTGAVVPFSLPNGPTGTIQPGVWESQPTGPCRRFVLVLGTGPEEHIMHGCARPMGTSGQWMVVP